MVSNGEKPFIYPDDLEWIGLNPHNLQYIWRQTDTLCLLAIKKDPHCLLYVKKQTLELCLAAITINPAAAKHIRFDDLPEEDVEYLKLIIS